MSHLYAAVAALVIGATLGLLGAGGSIMTVPLLVYVVGLGARMAMAMSLIVVGVTSATAALLHARDGRVRLGLALPFAMAGAPGSLAGSALAHHVPERALLFIFAAFMIAAAVALRRRRDDDEGAATPPPARLVVAAAGFVLGFVTGLLGAGGGFLIVPTLVLLFHVPMREAIGSSLVVITANAVVGLAARVHAVHFDLGLTALLTAAAVVGAVLGQGLSAKVPQATLRRWFSTLVIVVATYMILRTAGVIHG